jgi:hypothetical protein
MIPNDMQLRGQADMMAAAHALCEFTIQRDHDGTRARALPGKALGDETHKTFIYAIGKFYYLIEIGEKITLEDWRGRIAKHCAPSDRIAVVLKAIDAARGLKPEGAKHG